MSLTPQHRNSEASNEAMQEGLVSGGFVLIPSVATLYVAMQNKSFMMRTNWQSRTAMAIMPALFAFAWSAENYLHHKMQEIASETQHNEDTVRWAEAHHQERQQKQLQQQQQQQQQVDQPNAAAEVHLSSLYKKSVEESGVHVVAGDSLGLHHRMANYTAANPVKVLAGLAAPAVALILYGRTGKAHLQPSIMLMHTRVFGQFTTISLMLGIFGFKDYMDRNGRFITEKEADRRVVEMQQIRQDLMDRLEYEQEKKREEKRELQAAHDEDMRHRKEAKKLATAAATMAAH